MSGHSLCMATITSSCVVDCRTRRCTLRHEFFQGITPYAPRVPLSPTTCQRSTRPLPSFLLLSDKMISSATRLRLLSPDQSPSYPVRYSGVGCNTLSLFSYVGKLSWNRSF